jgi:hypothetical protein
MMQSRAMEDASKPVAAGSGQDPHAVRCLCPHCAAPLDLRSGSPVVICVFCRGTCRIVTDGAEAAAPPSAVKHEVDAQTTDRVIQLVVDGKRAEAVALYAGAAAVDAKDAERAVSQLVTSLVLRLGRHLPVAWPAAAIQFAIFGGMVFGAAWAAQRAGAGSVGFGLLAGALLILAWLGLRSLARHARSRIVVDFGTQGVARIVRRSVIREAYRPGGTLLVIHWEVRPVDGSEPFQDEETLLVRNESVEKLEPGNLVPVRFGGGRTLVFPVSPMTVVGRE